MLTSPANDKVKRIINLEKKAKARREEGLFVSEGLRMVLETPRELLRELYISEGFFRNVEHVAALEDYLYNGAPVSLQLDAELPDGSRLDYILLTVTSDDVMKKMADTEHPQGLLAVSEIPSYRMEDLLEGEAPLLLLAEDVQDPGNLGTMFRTAEGAGVQGFILSPGCADPTQPKVVRSTMGSIFRLPFLRLTEEADWTTTLQELQKRGIHLYAAWLEGSVSYDEPDYREASAFLIGNEGNGLKKETAEIADQKIRIPMGGQLESLNAAMSAGILMYEAGRQRRRG